MDPDDLLNTTMSDARGHFQIYGEEDEVRNIEPYLVIVHSCDNGVINPVRSIICLQNRPSHNFMFSPLPSKLNFIDINILLFVLIK